MNTETEHKRRLWREASLRYIHRHPERRKLRPEQKRQNGKKYYRKNKTAIAARVAEYRAKDPVRWREYRALWQQQNREKCLDYARAWRNKNPIAAELARSKWHSTHPGRRNQISKAYRMRNPDYVVRHHTKRRLRTGNTSGFDPLIDLMVKDAHARGRISCAYCSNSVTKFHIDHIIPLSRGGLHVKDNLCVACVRCNLSKGSKLVSEWKGRTRDC